MCKPIKTAFPRAWVELEETFFLFLKNILGRKMFVFFSRVGSMCEFKNDAVKNRLFFVVMKISGTQEPVSFFEERLIFQRISWEHKTDVLKYTTQTVPSCVGFGKQQVRQALASPLLAPEKGESLNSRKLHRLNTADPRKLAFTYKFLSKKNDLCKRYIYIYLVYRDL